MAAVAEEAAPSEAEIISSVGGQPESEKVIEVRTRETRVEDISHAQPTADAQPNDSESISHMTDNLPHRVSRRHRGGLDSLQSLEGSSALVLRQLCRRSCLDDTEFVFTMSVRTALRERGEDAKSVITAELQQMCDKKVWHGVHASQMTSKQRMSIIRSSMFLKDKYLASGLSIGLRLDWSRVYTPCKIKAYTRACHHQQQQQHLF